MPPVAEVEARNCIRFPGEAETWKGASYARKIYGMTAVAWFENALSRPVESTAVVT